jgi:hypothetical protein
MKTRVFYSETCPTCGRASSNPFRSYDAKGRIVNGCVDAFHSEHLVVPSESAFWHARPQAKLARRLSKEARNGGVTHYQVSGR